ncbi:MAG: hypothetical protein ACO3Z6_16250 [Pseudomonadales bacterium]
MIRNFRCKDTEALFTGKPVRRFRSIRAVAERKLALLHAAATIERDVSPRAA